ncbi:MAG: hypothetical protein R3E01_00775 [Pirellulaceae bacterium]|nr:hypothetical protein [Planctomycetales bacterium]
MPDPILMAKATVAAALVAAIAAIAAFLGLRPVARSLEGKRAQSMGASAGGASSRTLSLPSYVAQLASLCSLPVGYYIGCWVLGLLPNWPIVEDRDRMLWLVLPGVTLVEAIGCFAGGRRWWSRAIVWMLRLAISVAVARVLLHGSIYLADVVGPGTRKWDDASSGMILLAIGSGVLLVWTTAIWVTTRSSGRSMLLSFFFVAGAAAISIMLSGYATGGQLGLPLAGAIVGLLFASWCLPIGDVTGSPGLVTAMGFCCVTLASLLVVGHFFAELTARNAVILGLSPLLGAIPELIRFERFPRLARSGLRVALVILPLAFVLQATGRSFRDRSTNSGQAASGIPEPSVSDYMNFGK